MKCYLCPNMCGVDRERNVGLCHADNTMRICRIAPHFFEEPIISGERGSGTVFFGGCSLDCVFCQNYSISKKQSGREFSPLELSKAIRKLEEEGVHNINFVTPTHYADRIIETLKIYRPSVPIVYNTSGYERAEIIKNLASFVDIYLTDFKYSNNSIAEKYSRRKNYFDCCVEATEEMVKSKPLIYGDDGMLKQGVVIRHLMLPTETDNTLKAIEIFAERWKGRAVFSLMSQFFPAYNSPITRTLKPLEYKLAINAVIKHGIENCFVQELSAADKRYVPEFDLL